MKIAIKKGPPTQIRLINDTLPEIINGTIPNLAVQLFDRGSNHVTFDHPINVLCKFIETDEQRSLKTCVSEQQLIESIVDGHRCLVTNKVLQIKRTEEELNKRRFFVRFYVRNNPNLVLEQDIVVEEAIEADEDETVLQERIASASGHG